jgi:hypothetical protein
LSIFSCWILIIQLSVRKILLWVAKQTTDSPVACRLSQTQAEEFSGLSHSDC